MHTIKLDLWAYGGEAMGRLEDGRAVFVRGGIPGERVRVRLTEEKAHFARGVAVEVLEAAPSRVAPRCPYYGLCGGCHYQHVAYSAQLQAKTEIVRSQFQRIGGIAEPPVGECVPSPKQWGYRNHIQLHPTPEGKVGFRAAGSHAVLPVEDCLLAAEPLRAVIPGLEIDPQSGITRVHLRVGANDELMLWLRGETDVPPAFAVDFPTSAVYTNPWGESFLLSGRRYLVMEVGGRAFRVSAESFFQVNLGVAELLLEALLGALPPRMGSVLEVYSGVGLFSAALAERAAELVAVESSWSACADFEVNLGGADNVSLYEAPAEQAVAYLAEQGFAPEAVVLDPPRSGLEKEVLDALMKMKPEVIAYVSCDPATLARDVKRVARRGYRLVSATPFDMFPQTYHIETLAILKKE